MLTSIRGYYDQGRIVLQEEAPISEKTEVIITFLADSKPNITQQKRLPGGLKGKVTLPDDFNAPLDDLKDYM